MMCAKLLTFFEFRRTARKSSLGLGACVVSRRLEYKTIQDILVVCTPLNALHKALCCAVRVIIRKKWGVFVSLNLSSVTSTHRHRWYVFVENVCRCSVVYVIKTNVIVPYVSLCSQLQTSVMYYFHACYARHQQPVLSI